MASRRPTASRPTPLWASLSLTFLGSVGTGVVTNGIFFLTEQGFGFSRTRNYILGLLLGVTYILGSVAAGPAIARTRRLLPGVSSRAILATVLVLLGMLSTLPMLAESLSPSLTVPALWVLVAIYSPLTGVLWPMVESFVAGGRRGTALRNAMGIWNVVWSGAIIAAYLGMAPVIRLYPAQTLAGLGVLHAVTALLLVTFQPEPGEHELDHEPHPPVYTRLLVTFRMLLPMSYIVSSTLVPYLPTAMNDLGVPKHLHTILGTAWLVPRTIAFFILQRWHGWHGRWAPAVVGGLLLLAGFAASVLAPALFYDGGAAPTQPRTPGVVLLMAGLAVFGAAMALIYSAAIYYAMEVGNAGVDAGGTHEALIGLGYTVGPLCGLLASAGVDRGVLPDRAFNATALGAVGVIAAMVTLAVIHRVARHRRPG